MNSPGSALNSPKYKNLKVKPKQSPIELKEKMRKNYKDKVKNCREILLNRFRGSIVEGDLRIKLTEIYKTMFDFSDNENIDDDDELIEQVKSELVEEELNWWMKEYEMSDMNIDWSLLEKDEMVICPVCQKTNLTLESSNLSCIQCQSKVNTSISLLNIKKNIIQILESHNETCTNEAQFAFISDTNDTHIYLICEKCGEMKLVV